jgi:hypothetical protein
MWNMCRIGFARIAPAMSLSILLFLFVNPSYFHYARHDASLLLLLTFGGVVSFNGINIVRVLIFCLPFVIQLALFGHEMQSDIGTAFAYVFTRGEKRSHWLAKKFASILIQSIAFYLILFAVTLCCAALVGYSFDIAKVVSTIAALLPTLVFANTLLRLAVNLLTIKLRVPIVYAFTLTLYTGWITLLPLFRDNDLLLKAVHITRGLLSVHDISGIDMSLDFQITIASTALWMLCGVIILYGCGYVLLRRLDFLGGVD